MLNPKAGGKKKNSLLADSGGLLKITISIIKRFVVLF